MDIKVIDYKIKKAHNLFVILLTIFGINNLILIGIMLFKMEALYHTGVLSVIMTIYFVLLLALVFAQTRELHLTKQSLLGWL